MISRRSILRAIPALLAAPAIVKASSLMAVRPLPSEIIGYNYYIGEWQGMRFVEAVAVNDTLTIGDVTRARDWLRRQSLVPPGLRTHNI